MVIHSSHLWHLEEYEDLLDDVEVPERGELVLAGEGVVEVVQPDRHDEAEGADQGQLPAVHHDHLERQQQQQGRGHSRGWEVAKEGLGYALRYRLWDLQEASC